jgi:hypothetical protein
VTEEYDEKTLVRIATVLVKIQAEDILNTEALLLEPT